MHQRARFIPGRLAVNGSCSLQRGMMMDGNLAVLIAMIALMIGGAVLLNLQIKHDAKKEKEQKGKQ